MNLSELLARNSRKFGEKEAFVYGEIRLSYREVNEKVNQLVNSLSNLGITKGSKVVLFMPNTIEFVYSYFAIVRLGAVVVPINAKLGEEDVRYIVEHSEAEALISHELLYPGISPLTDVLDIQWIKTGKPTDGWYSLETLIQNGSNDEITCLSTDNDLTTMLYTSGTTGKPKGVLFSTKNILTVATMMCIETNMNDESCVLHMMPLSHSAPLHLFFVAGTYVGAKHVLSPTFTPNDLLQLVSQEKVTHFFGAPVAYLLTAKQPNINEVDLSSVTHWVYGGAPLSSPEVQFVQEKFQTNSLMCVYGLTEAGPNGTFLNARDHQTKAGSIGKRAALNCEIKIVDQQGNEVSAGEVGEILLRGEGNMLGYYKDPEKTDETLKDGWLHTGDLARQDEDGYIWVVDRKKDMIISGGVNIYPKEIEDFLKTHPSIADVAVIGIPNPDWGESVKAYVVVSEPVENLTEECKRFLDGKLASYKIPRVYEEVKELPRNATGKILKQQLRNWGERHGTVQG